MKGTYHFLSLVEVLIVYLNGFAGFLVYQFNSRVMKELAYFIIYVYHSKLTFPYY